MLLLSGPLLLLFSLLLPFAFYSETRKLCVRRESLGEVCPLVFLLYLESRQVARSVTTPPLACKERLSHILRLKFLPLACDKARLKRGFFESNSAPFTPLKSDHCWLKRPTPTHRSQCCIFAGTVCRLETTLTSWEVYFVVQLQKGWNWPCGLKVALFGTKVGQNGPKTAKMGTSQGHQGRVKVYQKIIVGEPAVMNVRISGFMNLPDETFSS